MIKILDIKLLPLKSRIVKLIERTPPIVWWWIQIPKTSKKKVVDELVKIPNDWMVHHLHVSLKIKNSPWFPTFLYNFPSTLGKTRLPAKRTSLPSWGLVTFECCDQGTAAGRYLYVLENSNIISHIALPIPSMYGIFTYIWLIFKVNVGKYTIHRWYGLYTLEIIQHLNNNTWWWFQTCFIFCPYLWKMMKIWRSYFSSGLKPPPSCFIYTGHNTTSKQEAQVWMGDWNGKFTPHILVHKDPIAKMPLGTKTPDPQPPKCMEDIWGPP